MRLERENSVRSENCSCTLANRRCSLADRTRVDTARNGMGSRASRVSRG
ncbi:MAG: hypothetical protein ACD_75C01249G0002 [uncultured bacterium]|nr:MAG: hypothetical protein ACD_75C01249G0002 [uncultured bacterium]